MPQTVPALPRRQCRHCGTPFAPRNAAEYFCCSGCEAVSGLIQSQGLAHFYDLRQGISTPVGNRGLEPRDFGWLQTLAVQAEADARATHTVPVGSSSFASTASAPQATGEAARPQPANTATAVLALPLSGIHCAGCRWLIAQLFAQQPAAATCSLDAEGQHIRFSWHLPEQNSDSGIPFDPVAFANLLLAFGYALENPALPRQAGHQSTDTASTRANARKRLAPRLLLCGVFALNAVIFSLPVRLGANVEDFPFLRLFGLLVFLCTTLATGLAASYFWQAHAQPASNSARRARSSSGSTITGKDHDTATDNNTAPFSPRRLVALVLILLCILSFAGTSLALPAIFAADAVAGASFVALLIAFAAKR